MTTEMTASVRASELRLRVGALLDEIHDTGGKLSVTRRHNAVADIVPVPPQPALRRPSLAYMVRFAGDLVTPIDAEWDAMR